MLDNLKKIITEFHYSGIIVSVIFLALASFHFLQGPVSSPDTNTFSRWGDLLLSVDFNLLDYYSNNNFVIPSYFYTIPIMIVASLKTLFGDAWKESFLFLNLLLLCGSLAISYRILRFLVVPPLLSALALAMLMVSDAYLVWPRYVLTDTMFATSVLVCFFLLGFKFHAQTSGGIRFTFIDFCFLIVVGCMVFTRPSATPYIVGLLSSWSALFFGFDRSLFTFRNVVIAGGCVLLVGSVVSSTLYWAQLFTSFDIRFVAYLAEKVSAGMVVLARTETWAVPPTNWLEIFKIFWLKALYFWAPWAEAFSPTHKLLNGCFWLFCAGAIFGWPFVKTNLSPFQRYFLKSLFITAVLVTTFHAATMVDFDWRYRYPLILPVLIAASCLYWQIFVSIKRTRNLKKASNAVV